MDQQQRQEYPKPSSTLDVRKLVNGPGKSQEAGDRYDP